MPLGKYPKVWKIIFALYQDPLVTQTASQERERPEVAYLPMASSEGRHPPDHKPGTKSMHLTWFSYKKKIWCFLQVAAAYILHMLFFVSLFLPSLPRDRSWRHHLWVEQSSDTQKGMICELFLLFSEHVICQCFLVVSWWQFKLFRLLSKASFRIMPADVI